MRRIESYKVLSEVYFKGRHAHLVLKELDLPAQDQAFVSAFVYATLQNSLFLDYQYEDLVDKKLPKEVRLVIKMGCAQYFKMDKIPDYALVSETVDLCKAIGKHRYSGVVNAVLKKVIERNEREISGSDLEVASIQYSMPLWIMKLLSKQYSESFSIAYAQYCQDIKPTYVRFNALKPTTDDLSDFILDDQDKHLAKPALFKSKYLQEGYVLVQDINSQEVVRWMDLEPSLSVLDCCCGPGTKTVQIANYLENSGTITGVELHESRAEATRALLERCNVVNANIITSDVLQFQTDQKYDRILVDAPCSGLGVLSHKHDLRYHIFPQDLDELVKIQQEMLIHTSQFVKKDGILVYSTCTLNRKENEKQVQTFLDHHSNFELIKEVTLNPVETKGDGFYIAKLKRTC
ncbi:transcription antitermination factor NusB [Erysipelothrix rhusiopathiae]|uniref:transcription antitermination factor NusB n=1 Tax=Erysipelothrix rhusiopathiae TaxID=1648 RepID=UPI000E0876B1|nr:transcription antitermination factor NusB [Erysipelothrix rhusiopathiae]MCG4436111.1 methyltransferase domain-containing protein [Erysipelothrix rhusiopathiae]MCG4456788.1 methyltransferase domain-containing protein [Erysipelothrix rhusiopathiae]MDE8032507.1 transcription antitermination factor NusB [Erysipelothrix rhusiopathiae]MDE8036070.1 transcription antitermination factor NusB [Erysipelothrix rhusiopathiae]MDE8043317.1 transcription antitermination factor NusB [Erysipelothrix rhusiopa